MSIRRFIPFVLWCLALFVVWARRSAHAGTCRRQANALSVPADTLPVNVRNLTRFEREIIHFEEIDRAAMPASGSILFVGSPSSHTAMENLWPQDMAPLPVLNRGFGGATIGEVNYYFSRIVGEVQTARVGVLRGRKRLVHKHARRFRGGRF